MESQVSNLKSVREKKKKKSVEERFENWDLNFEKQEKLLVCVVEWSPVWSVLMRVERERSGWSFGPGKKVLPNAKGYHINQFCFWDKDKNNGVFLWD